MQETKESHACRDLCEFLLDCQLSIRVQSESALVYDQDLCVFFKRSMRIRIGLWSRSMRILRKIHPNQHWLMIQIHADFLKDPSESALVYDPDLCGFFLRSCESALIYDPFSRFLILEWFVCEVAYFQFLRAPQICFCLMLFTYNEHMHTPYVYIWMNIFQFLYALPKTRQSVCIYIQQIYINMYSVHNLFSHDPQSLRNYPC